MAYYTRDGDKVRAYYWEGGRQRSIPRAVVRMLDGRDDASVREFLASFEARRLGSGRGADMAGVVSNGIGGLVGLAGLYSEYVAASGRTRDTARTHLLFLKNQVIPYFAGGDKPIMDPAHWGRRSARLGEALLAAGLSASSVAGANAALRGFVKWLWEEGYIANEIALPLRRAPAKYRNKKTPLAIAMTPDDVLGWCSARTGDQIMDQITAVDGIMAADNRGAQAENSRSQAENWGLRPRNLEDAGLNTASVGDGGLGPGDKTNGPSVTARDERDKGLSLVALIGYFFSLRPQEILALRPMDFVVGPPADLGLDALALQAAGLPASGLSVSVRRQRGDDAINSFSKPKAHSSGVVACTCPVAAGMIKRLVDDVAAARGPRALLFPRHPRAYVRSWGLYGIPETTLKDLRRASLLWLGHHTALPATALMAHARHRNFETTELYLRRPEEDPLDEDDDLGISSPVRATTSR